MPSVICLFVVLLFIPNIKGSSSLRRYSCSRQRDDVTSIGVVINYNTRVGKEQKIAMEIAVRDIFRESCSRILLHIRDSSESSVHATSLSSKLIRSKKIEVLVGTFSLTEAMFLSEVHKNFLGMILLLTPTAISPSLMSPQSNLIQLSHSFSIHMQCLADIIGYFQWRRVTVIYERNNLFPLDSTTFSVLSDSLKTVGVTIEHQVAFPPINSLSDPEFTIEQELHKLKNGSNRVFILTHSSLILATYLFRKAHQFGMVEKGFVWIISDEIASLLDSVDPSVIASMQGVLGYKTSIIDTSKSYREFEVKFRQSYVAKFPYDQGNPSPTLFALRAYDAIHAISKAKNALKMPNSKALSTNLLSSNFEGLSGDVSFRNGELEASPTFQIINVVGKSYKELAFWTPELRFSTKPLTLIGRDALKNHSRKGMLVNLGPIYWPGGQQEVPKGWNAVARNEKAMRIVVPASGAFRLVNVTNVTTPNRTHITGFVIDVFKTSLKYLDLQYELVPFYGKYDDMVRLVKPGAYDAAVGDILILEERYKWADFSQPFVKSGMNMVVTVEEDITKEMWIFTTVFEKKTWILIILMGLFVGFVVWLVEHQRNPEFAGTSFSQQVGKVFWFSFTLYFFVQKESPRSNLSKIVLAPWYFLVLVLTIYFTAALTSLMTVSQLLPSVKDVETLRRDNAVVACNWNSFVCSYLVDVLHFKRENVRQMKSVENYPPAFERGEIKAAFFVSLHAKVFLTKYCRGYTIAGPTYNFGGFGFAFQKGSVLSANMSEAILKATESGEIEALEKKMLAQYKCSALSLNNSTTNIGPEPFAGLFFICGGFGMVTLLIIVVPLVEQQFKILCFFKESILSSRICTWALKLSSRIRTSFRSWLSPNSTL